MHKFFVVQFTVFGLFLVSNCFEDMDIQQISSLVESSEVVNFNLRVKKTSRLTYGVSGYIEILDDSMDKYTFEIKIFHSANGNNQFKLYPMGFRTMPIKRFMNRQYREYFMDDLKPPVSELPYSLNQWSDLSSQVRKGNFTITNFFFKKEKLPSVLPNGLWKIMHIVRKKKNGDVVGGFKLYSVLY